jgi:hypothetical protein
MSSYQPQPPYGGYVQTPTAPTRFLSGFGGYYPYVNSGGGFYPIPNVG